MGERALVRQMAGLANELLDSLGPQVRARACLAPIGAPEVEAERVRWFYAPTDHGGVALGELAPRRQRLAMRLLASGLTPQAYATVCTVLGLENVLDELEGWSVDWGRERGRDPGAYWIRVFGYPGDATWGWRFGGHHVSVNLLLRDGRVASATPSFIGADPAVSRLLAGELRPLGGTEDLARALMTSLGTAERAQALLHERAVSDIVSGNRARLAPGDTMMHMRDLFRGPPPAALVDRVDEADHDRMALGTGPRGIAARDLTAEQRQVLRDLIAAYTDRSPVPVAEDLRRHYAEAGPLDAVHFGWAGSLARGWPHYYRLTGPRLLIEYGNTQRGANHAHSVWRDPAGDFGLISGSARRAAAPPA